MVKVAVIGALASLFVLGGSARADWRTPLGNTPILPSVFRLPHPHVPAWPSTQPMPGAKPILPSRFEPMGYEVIGPQNQSPLAPASDAALSEPDGEVTFQPSAPAWTLPLMDRRLSQSERDADIAPELLDAIARAEPIYDPTRLDGLDAEVVMQVSAGTATMDNVFADHWRRASPDPNVGRRVTYLATAWDKAARLPCTAFFKNREHGVGEPMLNALSAADCRRLESYSALAFNSVPPSEITPAPISVPVFAAPMPGSRMSSQEFWAARRAHILAIQQHLRDDWHQNGAKFIEAAKP